MRSRPLLLCPCLHRPFARPGATTRWEAWLALAVLSTAAPAVAHPATCPPPAPCAQVQSSEVPVGPQAPCAPATQTTPLDLNRADAETLQALPGIGPARARAILALRARLGRFRHLAQLLRVHGIGRRTLARLRPLIAIERAEAVHRARPAPPAVP